MSTSKIEPSLVTESIKSLASYISELFRHIMPGCLILVLSMAACPKLRGIGNFNDKIWLCIFLILVVGNVMYVLHRMIIHQTIDWFVWRLTRNQDKTKSYFDRMAKMISWHSKFDAETRSIIHLKNSQVILMAITGELLFLFSFVPIAHAGYLPYSGVMKISGLTLLAASAGAHYLSQMAVIRLIELTDKEDQSRK
jgi:hypothetical protein